MGHCPVLRDWNICLKMLRAVEVRGGRGYGSNTGECIEVKTREPLNSVMETLKGGGNENLLP